jgi:hypothetical protein
MSVHSGNCIIHEYITPIQTGTQLCLPEAAEMQTSVISGHVQLMWYTSFHQVSQSL